MKKQTLSFKHMIKSGNWWDNKWTKGAMFERHNRKKMEKAIGYSLGGKCKLRPPLHICFTRYASRRLDDDNLPRGFKHIRDGFCAAITGTPLSKVGDADACPGLSFEYRQASSSRKECKFTIEVKKP